MFKPIWKTIFKPIWKTIYNPEYGEEQPPKVNSLLSWTFADDILQTLYSKDRITASDEPARFVSSFCLAGSGAVLTSTVFRPPLGLQISGDWRIDFNYNHTNASTGALAYIFELTTDASYSTFKCGIGVGGTLSPNKLFVYDGTTTLSCTTTLTIGSNYKLSVSRSGNNFSFYIDDILVNSLSGVGFNIENIATIGGRNVGLLLSSTGKVCNIIFRNNTNIVAQYPCQGGFFDVSNNALHGQILTTTPFGLQDMFHYNISNGFDKYSKDGSSPTFYIYVPYVNGVPVVSSITGYTKVSSHPAGKWHNGAETKVVVGTNGIKDANGWQAVSTVKDKLGNVVSVSTADPNNIFINTTTGYCIEKDVSSMPSISTGDYVFLDNSVANKYRNLLWYRADQLPLFYDAQKAYDFVNGSGAVEDEFGRALFDEFAG